MTRSHTASTSDGATTEPPVAGERQATAERDAAEQPFVSVVIPVYEDPDGLAVTLRSLVAQTYPDDRHEVVVVDNGSADRTPAVARQFARANETVRTIVEPESGSYAARNAGIRAAEGTVLSFVDADMSVDPDWLAAVVDRLERTGAAFLACDVTLEEAAGPESLAERYNRRTAFPIREYVEEWSFAPTCCLTVRREVFDEVGLFDAALVSSGDREFGNRVAAAGYDLAFAPDVSMTHPLRTSTRALVSKAVRIGRGSYQLRERYPDRYGSRVTLLVNPLTYTPPLPRSMSDHVTGWDGLSATVKLQFTLLAWLLTLAKAYGKLSEAAADVGIEDESASRAAPAVRSHETGEESVTHD